MAFWGPPFTDPEEHGRLACLAALDQLAAFAQFRTELPELTGIRRGLPEIDVRIGIEPVRSSPAASARSTRAITRWSATP